MNEIKPRLRRIRDYVNGKRGKRLLVLFRSSDGTEMIGNADDLITQRGDFVRVLSGNSLTDFDKTPISQIRRHTAVFVAHIQTALPEIPHTEGGVLLGQRVRGKCPVSRGIRRIGREAPVLGLNAVGHNCLESADTI